jgi:hypothetical protein
MKNVENTDYQRLKRHASEIVSQLPQDRDSALRVLDYARELVEWEAAPPGYLRPISISSPGAGVPSSSEQGFSPEDGKAKIEYFPDRSRAK